jgi:RNA polymerase sigma factor (sigma-70 family)
MGAMTFATPTGPNKMATKTTTARTATEPELLAAAQRGDGAAFDQLVAIYRRPLHAHCYRMLGSLQDTEDALQETLLAAWRGLSGFEGRSSLRSWLYRVAHNACRTRRAVTRRPAISSGRTWSWRSTESAADDSVGTGTAATSRSSPPPDAEAADLTPPRSHASPTATESRSLPPAAAATEPPTGGSTSNTNHTPRWSSQAPNAQSWRELPAPTEQAPLTNTFGQTYPRFNRYRQRSSRIMPIVLLTSIANDNGHEESGWNSSAKRAAATTLTRGFESGGDGT